MARTPQQIFDHHGMAMDSRNLDAILEDYTDQSVVITAERVYRGKREIRAFFSALLDALPQAEWAVPVMIFEGNALYIEWTVKSSGHNVNDGVDTFVFAHGAIALQTARASLVKSRLDAL
jgi:predicted SnoaL-like aldol condensation-catalyzing enzyme